LANKKVRDQDYLFLSTYIHARENRLLSAEDLERMVTAPSKIEVGRVLEEAGYEGVVGAGIRTLEQKLAENRLAFYQELKTFAPDPAVLDIFRAKYDYHNAKAIIKSLVQNKAHTGSLTELGRIPSKDMVEAIVRDETSHLPDELAKAVAVAREKLAQTQNPQTTDLIMDKAYFREIISLADASGCSYAVGYVKLLADVTNLRTTVRIRRQKKPDHLLETVFIPGGEVRVENAVKGVIAGQPMEEIFTAARLRSAAEAGTEALKGGTVTEFERRLDNVMNNYCAEARRENFGPATLVAYLHFLENEATAVRIIVTSRAAGLRGDQIRERLRDL